MVSDKTSLTTVSSSTTAARGIVVFFPEEGSFFLSVVAVAVAEMQQPIIVTGVVFLFISFVMIPAADLMCRETCMGIYRQYFGFIK